jgi:hypothetical protein
MRVQIDSGQMLIRRCRALVMTADAELLTPERLFCAIHEAHAISVGSIQRRLDDDAHRTGGKRHITCAVGDIDVTDDLCPRRQDEG